MSRDIGAENRNTFRALADILIPAGQMPSASDAGVADAGLDKVLDVRPDIFADLIKALVTTRSLDPVEAVDIIPTQYPEAWQALRLAVFGAYFNAPAVQKALGYAGQPAMPFDPDCEPEYAPSLERVIGRGRNW